jgi:LPXTG-motif cell wall-anchored protein
VYYDVVHTPTAHPEPGTAAMLSSTAWETTGAKDQDGNDVALTDPAVVNSVGWAYYRADGTFSIYNLDDAPRLRGDWSVENGASGLTRTLVAKDESGAVQFTRTVPIITLTSAEFTYRLFPDAANPAVYLDIIHTPTTHSEPQAVGAIQDEEAEEDAPPATTSAGNATTALAKTGADATVAGIVAAALALLGGAALALRRVFRRTSEAN